jgi:hypothetical protein
MAGKIITNCVALGDHATDSNNFVLKTNVDGTATFARGVAGNLGTVFGVNGSGALTGVSLVSPTITGLTAAMPAGSVLQVVSATKTDTSSFTSSTFADIGTLTVTLTPRNTSSKILVVASVGQSWVNAVAKSAWRLMRGATPIAIADAAGSRIRSTGGAHIGIENYVPSYSSISYLDSPATASAVTYKCQASNLDNVGTVYVNRANSDPDTGITPRTASSITIFEIAG